LSSALPSQWLHIIGRKAFLVFGNVPMVSSWMTALCRPRDTLFSALQATVQALQPMHLRKSITIPQRGTFAAAWAVAAGTVRAMVPAAAVPAALLRNFRRFMFGMFDSVMFQFS
ncbi:MAG: hypothetical protein OER96_13260, partial [Gammaproteobacteria bacterium]|nr:hypothetical protein [Gammaproteobacteria bacterium]